MKNSLRLTLACFLLLNVLVFPAQAQKQKTLPYTCITLGTLGGDFSHANGVNKYGAVVGYSTFIPGTVTLNHDERAFYWKDLNGNNVSDPGEIVYLGSLGYNSVANGINDLGEVVGFSKTANGDVTTQRAVLFHPESPGVITDLNDLMTDPADQANWVLNIAYAINNNRQVTGIGYRRDLAYQSPFLLDLNTGAVTDLSVLSGQTYMIGFGLNNLNPPQVVGNSIGSPNIAFLFSSGLLLNLSPMTNARGINNTGSVVGMINGHPAYWSGVTSSPMVDLGTFGLDTTKGEASAINDAGLVVGNTGGDKKELGFTLQHAFRWQAGTAVSTKQDLNSLTAAPYALRHALGVSSNGYIVGYGNKGTISDPSSIDQAYLLKPN